MGKCKSNDSSANITLLKNAVRILFQTGNSQTNVHELNVTNDMILFDCLNEDVSYQLLRMPEIKPLNLVNNYDKKFVPTHYKFLL